ncbi:MAG: hypothetical protein ACREBD_08740 [Blastocatellia bacterium]
MTRGKITFAIFLCLLASVLVLSDRATPISSKKVEAQSACTPPLYQGYPSACSNIYLRWLNRDPISAIDRFEIYRGGLKVGEVPGSAISFSEPVGCSFAAVYTIKQVMKSGASCQTVTTGNPPHTKPCDLCPGGGGPGTLNVVSAASFNPPVPPGSIATLFADPGQTLTSATAPATGATLPTNIAGTQVLVNGTPTGLFYVSPNQINFLIPQSAVGTTNIVINGSNGERTEGALLTAPNPAIFMANSRANGVAAALVTSDGRSFQPVADASGAAVPISVGSPGQPSYLILFGTGMRTQGPVQVRIAGRDCIVAWSGAHSLYAGLDQINVQLPDSLRGLGMVTVAVTVGGFTSNFAQINIGN